jgi:predicted RNase H-like HicB family nuclease
MMKKKYSYPVIYEAAEEGGYIVYVPSLPGCHSQGDTLEEAEANITEAIEVYLESLIAHNSVIPVPKNIYQSTIEVAV